MPHLDVLRSPGKSATPSRFDHSTQRGVRRPCAKRELRSALLQYLLLGAYRHGAHDLECRLTRRESLVPHQLPISRVVSASPLCWARYMAYSYAQANLAQRGLRRLGATVPGSWVFSRLLHHIDRPVHTLTGGRHTLASLLTGLPVVMLTTTGARSGISRTVPLLGLPTSDGLAVIASNWGQAWHPARYYNLRVDPRATVVVNGETRRVTAVVATDDRRARIWQQGLKVYPGWSHYERRTSHRDIAVYVLEPQ